jgi:hypothetical protein
MEHTYPRAISPKIKNIKVMTSTERKNFGNGLPESESKFNIDTEMLPFHIKNLDTGEISRRDPYFSVSYISNHS